MMKQVALIATTVFTTTSSVFAVESAKSPKLTHTWRQDLTPTELLTIAYSDVDSE